MNILFIHRSYPGQFKYISTVLALEPKNKVVFITEEEGSQMGNLPIYKILYKPEQIISNNFNPYLTNYENAVLHGKAVMQKAIELKQIGFKPDVIVGFSGWGSSMFIKNVFPDVPFLLYCEWYGQVEGSKFGFGQSSVILEDKIKLRCDNSTVLTALEAYDAGISPTNWQKSQFPKEYQDKIHVVHDGIDTGRFNPDENVKFLIKEKNLELTAQDEVITYGTRGFEPCRGFPQFMETVVKLLKNRPNAHFVIAGNDTVHYSPIKDKTYKEIMLEKLDLENSQEFKKRVHFVGTLPFEEYRKFLQVSSAHIYLTYPFVLSWSLLEAMSSGCCVMGSNTAPVLEVIEDNYNGLLTDFFNVNMLVEKIEYAMENKEKMKEIRQNARQTVIDKYDLKKVLPQQIKILTSLL